MKDTIKLFSTISGIFRSVVTILLLLGIVFTVLVDVNLLVEFINLLGFDGLSEAIVKPIIIVALALLFIVNFIITRNIFNAGKTGKYHASNFVFGLLFLAITVLIYISLRNLTTNLIYVFFALNGLIVINSILGMIAKAHGKYETEVLTNANKQNANDKAIKKKDYIEFEDINEDDQIKDNVFIINKTIEEEEPLEDTGKKEKVNSTEKISETSDEKKEELRKDEKKVFESSSKNSENLENSTNKNLDKSPEQKTNTSKKDVLIEKSTTNKISYKNERNEETYGQSDKEKIKKAKEEKIYSKEEIVKKKDK